MMKLRKLRVLQAFSLVFLACLLVSSFSSMYHVSLLSVPGVGATDFFSSGFELGDPAWTGTSKSASCNVSSQTSVMHTDSYAQLAECIGGASPSANRYIDLPTFPTRVFTRAYVRFPNLTLNDDGDRFAVIWYSITVSGWDKGVIGVRNVGGSVRWYATCVSNTGTSWTSNSTWGAIQLNTWYCVEFEMLVAVAGYSRMYVNGVKVNEILGLNNTRDQAFIGRVRVGQWCVNTNHNNLKVFTDDVVIADTYIGTGGPPPPPPRSNVWALIGTPALTPKVDWVKWALANQSISYVQLNPGDVVNFASIQDYTGLIVFTGNIGGYNTTAVRQFSQLSNGTVIIHIGDYVTHIHSQFLASDSNDSGSNVYYNATFGWFKQGDSVPFNDWNIDSISSQIQNLPIASFLGWSNTTRIASFNTGKYTIFREHLGSTLMEGFFVLDLNSICPETEFAPVWHLMNIFNLKSPVKIGKYIGSEGWLGTGTAHQSLAVVMRWWHNFQGNHSEWVTKTETWGTSVSARQINVTFIGNGTRYMLIDAGIHGNEKNPVAAIRYLASYIVADAEGGGYWSRRLQEVTLVFNEVYNPDGYNDNHRENNNGIDLNRDFPPYNMTGPYQPETRVTMNLFGNYSFIAYTNFHEGADEQPNRYIYSQTMNANLTQWHKWVSLNIKSKWAAVNNWGYYTEGGLYLKLNWAEVIILSGGVYLGCAVAYAGQYFNTSAELDECVAWSSSHLTWNHGARQLLYAVDFYCNSVERRLAQYDRLRSQKVMVGSTASIVTTSATATEIRTTLNTTGLTGQSRTWIHCGGRTKPLQVSVDGKAYVEGTLWSWNRNNMTVVNANASITLSWNVPQARYQFTFQHLDLDNVIIDNLVTWRLFNGSVLLTYSEGNPVLTPGTYTLKTAYMSHDINVTSLSTTVWGNLTVPIKLQMKRISTSAPYVAFNRTIQSFNVASSTEGNTTFTVLGPAGAFMIILRVPRNCTYIQKTGVNQSFAYSETPSMNVVVNGTTLSGIWKFAHAAVAGDVLALPYVAITLTAFAVTGTGIGYYGYRKLQKSKAKRVE